MFRQLLKNIMDGYIAFECRFVKVIKHDDKRVLIFRKDVLGDFILFLPTIKLYRDYYRDSRISLVVNTLVTDLIPNFSYIDDLIIFDQKKFRTNFWYRRNFMHNLKRQGFDIAIYPVYSREPIGDLLINITEAKEKISFKNEPSKRDSTYTRLIESDPLLNEIERNMAFAREVTNLKTRLAFPTIDVKLLPQENTPLIEGRYCIMFPGAGASYRIWQLEKFSEIADHIVSKGYNIVICGTKNENPLAEKIINEAKAKKQIINLCGKTNVSSLAHILNKSVFYFGSETGVLHLATAVGTPTICILGSGHFGRFFPYGDLEKNRIVFDENAKCRNDDWKCSAKLKPGEIALCIKNITVESAKKEIDYLLEKI